MTAIRWWILFGLVILPFLVVPGLGEQYSTAKALWLSVVTSVALLTASVLILRHADDELIWRWTKTPGVQAAGAFLVVLIGVWLVHGVQLHGLWGSFLRSNGVWFSIMIIAFSTVALMVFHLQKHWSALWWVISGSGVVLICAEMVARLGVPLSGVAAQGAYSSFIGNSSFFAGYLLIGLWATVALWLVEKQTLSRRLSGVFGLIIVVGMLLTQSRAAVLAVIAAAVITGGVALVTGDRKTKQTKVVGAAVVLIVLVYLVAQIPVVAQQLPRSLVIDPSALTSQTRLLHWQSGMHSWLDAPLLGWGPGNYVTAAAAHVSEEIFTLSPSDAVVDDPHNVFLRRLVEGGILLGLVYVGLFAALLLTAYRIKSRDAENGNRDAQLIVAATVGYAVYSFFSVEHNLVELGFWTIIGWGIFRDMQAQPALPAPRNIQFGKIVGYGAGVIAVVGVIGTLFMIPNVLRSQSMNTALLNKQWFSWEEQVEALAGAVKQPYGCAAWDQQAVMWLDLSALETSIVPHDLFVQAGLHLVNGSADCAGDTDAFLPAWRNAQLHTRLSNMTAAVSRTSARELWGRLLAVAPQHAFIHFGLAESYVDAGQFDEAIAQLEEFRDAHPGIVQVYDMLGMIHRIAGDERAAQAIEAQRP